MSSLLQKVATLRVVLSELEKEIGIEDIGTIEKKVLLAIADISSLYDVVEIKRVKDHRYWLDRENNRALGKKLLHYSFCQTAEVSSLAPKPIDL